MGKKLLSVFFLLLIFFLSSFSGFGQVCPTSVSVSSNQGNTICEDTEVTFTANVNGGTGTFSYQWKINGTNIENNSQTLQTSTLTNGQSVSVVVTATEGTTCNIGSDGYTMTVNSKKTPTVDFSIPTGTKCIGQDITFTATNTNGGSNPEYEWFVNGSSVQKSTSNKLTRSFASNDNFDIKVILTSKITCYTRETADVTKSVTIQPDATISVSNPDIGDACLNTSISPITFNVGGSATGATVSGLPSGVTGNYNSGTFTISGRPTTTGSFPYTVTTTGPCSSASASGTITVLKDATIALNSANNSQEVCQGEAIENIIYFIGETGNEAIVSGLPTGINGTYSGGNFTISGSSNNTGTYNYTIYGIGTCGNSQTLNGSIKINENLTPTISISSSDPDNDICEGTEVTFTANVTNGGNNPSFQWKLNGVSSGSTTSSNTFTTASLENNDTVTAELTSFEICTTSNPVLSNSITTLVNENLQPEVNITVSDSDFCQGDSVTFTATPINGGTPTYQWRVDGANVSGAGSTYITNSLTNGQEVSVVMTSSETCLTEKTATSNIIEVSVNPNLTPAVSISSNDTDSIICSGSTIQFTASPTNEGSDPTYEWFVDNNSVGNNSPAFSSNSLTNGQKVKVILTSSEECLEVSTAESNEITINVDSSLTSINPTFDNTNTSHNSTAICPVTDVTYKIHPIDGARSYNWTYPSGWSVVSQNANIINLKAGLNATGGQITVTANNNCGDSQTLSHTVTTGTAVLVDAGPDQTVCLGTNSISLAGQIGGAISQGTDFTWGVSVTGGTLSDQMGNNASKKLNATYTLPTSIKNNGGTITFTISSIKPAGNCDIKTDTMVLTVLKNATISDPANKNQAICINTSLTNIDFAITDAGTGATVTGLPNGLSGTFSNNNFTISGTPTQSGTFNYTVNTTGNCTTQQISQSGTITVNPDNTIGDATNKDQTVCINTAIASMAFPINSSVTNVTTAELPGGVTGSIVGSDFVISGTPTESGTFNFTLTTTGSCESATTTGVLVVNPDVTISSPTNKSQEVCINTDLQNIVFDITAPGNGATITGLPEGLITSFDNGVFTVSGSPTEAGTFEYSIETTGECNQADEAGTITVIADPTATISYVGPFCTSQAGSSSVILEGTGNFEGGIFTSSPEGLTISSTSGAITPESSTPGTYLITYTGPDTCNAAVATAELIITEAPLVEISYGGPYCNSDSTLKDPVFTNGKGNYQNGEFTSSQPGGLIIDKETGQINPQTSSPGTYDVFYTIDDTASGCELVTVSTEVIITQNPQITISYTEFLCSSETSVAVTTSGMAGAYEGGTFTGTSGLAINANGTVDASASTPGAHTVTYSIDASAGCSEVLATANFTIKEVPAITTHPSNTGVCSNSPAEFRVVATGDDLIYQWYKIVNGTAESIPGENDPILSFSNVTSADALQYYVEVTGDSACGLDTSEIVTLNVDEDITITDPTEDITICEDSEDLISFFFRGHANGAPLTFNWIKDGNIINEIEGKIDMEITGPDGEEGVYTGTLTITDPAAGEDGDSGVYWVVVEGPDYFTCSEATSKTFTFKVEQKPAPPTYTNAEYCLNADAGKLMATGEDGSTIRWYTYDESTSTYVYIGDDYTIDTSEPEIYEFYATQKRPDVNGISGCESDFPLEPLIITVLDTPDPVSTENIKFEYCYGEDVNDALNVTSAEGATIKWYASAVATETIDPPIPATSSTGVTTYYVSQTYENGCESNRTAVEVTIKALPNVVVDIEGGQSTVCLGSTVTLNLSGADTYTLHLDGAEIDSGNGPSFEVTPNKIGENIYTIMGEANGCLNTYNVSIFVDEVSVAGTLTPDNGAICISDGSVTLTLSGATGDVTKWEYRNASTSNVWTETEVVDLSAERSFTGLTETTEYRVTVKNGVCAPATSEPVSVKVDSLPVAGELSFAEFGRLYTTCEDPELLVDLHLNNYNGQIVAWKYRTVNQTNFTTISGETEETLPASTIASLLDNETLIFQAYIANGACSTPVASRNAILSVISSNIEPAPVTVSDEVICLGTEVTLSAETGYQSGDGIGDSGNFDNASINQHGWRIINAAGNEENFETSANNTAPNVWRRVTPREFTTANLSSPYATSPKLFDHGLTDANKGFALVSGPNTSKLETSIFTLDGLDEAILTFDQAYNLTPGASITVSISENGGSTWTQLYSNNGDPSSGNYTDFASGTPQDRPENKIEIDLGDYLGQSNLRIQFSFVGARSGDVWAVDNIVVPDGPSNVGIIWEDTTIDPENPTLIGYNPSEKWTPTKIGWNVSVITTTLEYTGGSCKTAVHNEEIKVFVFDKYNTSVTADYGSCGNFTAQLNAVVTNGSNVTIQNYPTPDGYIGKWEVSSGTLIDSDPEDGIAAINDPNAILSTDATGNYTVSWILEPTEVDENGILYANPEACPPVINPLEVVIQPCTALDFDGDNDVADLGEGYTGDYSIEAWILPFDRTKEDGTITDASKGTVISTPQLEINMEDLSGLVSTNGRWYHVAVDSDGKLYIDGIDAGKTISKTGTERAFIGARWNAPNIENHFSGYIEEVRIWKNKITQENIRFTMNQRLKADGNIGVEVDMDHPDAPDFGNLAGYFQLIATNILDGGYTPNLAGTVNGKLRNMETLQENTAPLPYYTANNGNWDTPATWAQPEKWKLANTGGITWNIVRTSHNVNANRDVSVLGLVSEVNTLTMEGTNPTVWQSGAGGSGNPLIISHYLRLDGGIDLAGESQLLQPELSIVDTRSAGWLERDQQGTASSYNYNYWSSPVSSAAGNVPYTIGGAMKDGSNPASGTPANLNFGDPYAYADGAIGTPRKISRYWLNLFHGNENVYAEWHRITEATAIPVGEGYTMKGTSGNAGIPDAQNYTFRGIPNNGDVNLSISAEQSYLIGNPYPSAIDADKFIKDNLLNVTGGQNTVNSFNGTLYFWSHFGGKTHILKEYEGGYAVYNLAGGIKAINTDERILNSQNTGGEAPKQFIPVGQSFFVNSTSVAEYASQNTSGNNPPNISGGPIKFRNSQRIFDEEGDHSVFHKPEIVVKGNKEVKDHTDKRTKFWLKFKSPKGYHREILVAADQNTTDGFDLGYDAPMIEYNIEDMFWLIGATELVIQGVPDFDKARVIPMGLVIDGTEAFTIEIAKSVNVPEGMEIYLKDKVTDSIHDLSKTGYVSTSEPGYINERFEIVFLKEDPKIEPNPENPGEEIDYGVELSFKHAHVGRELQILNPKQVPINELLLFDMNGKLITTYKNIAHEKEVRLPVKNYSAGVYIAKLYAEGTVITKKIIIQN